MNSIQTQCRGCHFAKLDDSSEAQAGCDLDRLKILNPNNETGQYDNQTFQICQRFCNCYRPSNWFQSLSTTEAKDPKGVVMREVAPRMGFFIYLDTNAADPIEDLQHTITCIKNQNNHVARYVAVVHSQVEYNLQIADILATSFDHDITHYHIVQTAPREEKLLQIDDAFTHALNGWIYVTTSGEDIPVDLIDKAHKRVNIDLRRLVVVEPYDDINGFIFQTALFKYLGGNKSMLESEFNKKVSRDVQDTLAVNTDTFLERVKSIPTTDKDTIVSWKEFMDG